MGKTYRTMRGKEVDFEKLNLKNETLPAVGNMRVNARGDEIGVGGKIIRTREQVLADYYKNNPRDAGEVGVGGDKRKV
jgi:hypothetical protein